MGMSKFRVGQEWRARNGDVFEIIKDCGPTYAYPIRARLTGAGQIISVDQDGRFAGQFENDDLDLLELVFDPTALATTATATQVAGDHYKKCAIQPIEYIEANGLGYHEGNVIKYITRHGSKGGVDDLRKARHYIDMLIEFKYGEGKP